MRFIVACLLVGSCLATAPSSTSAGFERAKLAFIPASATPIGWRITSFDPLAATSGGEDAGPSKKKKKKKKNGAKFIVVDSAFSTPGDSTVASVSTSTDGGVKSNLGVPSKRQMKDKRSDKVSVSRKKNSAMSEKLKRQRTSGGTVDSNSATILTAPPSEQDVLIKVAKRGSKSVTMVQGMSSPMDVRKKLLKEMKGALGGGGTLVEGVLELQGSNTQRVLDLMKKNGFSKARVVGK